jgi:hypothetical protein
MATPTITTPVPDSLAVARLIGEAERYLAAVDAFREEGCQPSWAREHMDARSSFALSVPQWEEER